MSPVNEEPATRIPGLGCSFGPRPPMSACTPSHDIAPTPSKFTPTFIRRISGSRHVPIDFRHPGSGPLFGVHPIDGEIVIQRASAELGDHFRDVIPIPNSVRFWGHPAGPLRKRYCIDRISIARIVRVDMSMPSDAFDCA